MEILSYCIHRFLFHGILWRIHQTHHRKDGKDSMFELNDIFSLSFALIAMMCLWVGHTEMLTSIWFATGVGITLYGISYFIVHDVFTHRRYFSLKTSSSLMQIIRKAHQRHHQSVEYHGQEPYGLFLFPRRFAKPTKK